MAEGAAPSSAAGRGQTELLRAWSQRFRKPLLRFFQRRMDSNAECEDLVQDVFVKLARRNDLETIERVDSYLFEAAANTLKDWRRKQVTHARSAHESLSDDLADVDVSPERVLVGRDSLRILVDALGSLPERTRMVFVLYHFEYLPHAEISRRLGIAVRTVEDHMARANATLLARMADLKP